MKLINDIRRKLRARALAGQSVEASGGGRRILGLPRWAAIIAGFALAAFLYWGVLGFFMSSTEADLSQRPPAELLPPGGSVAAGTAAMLIIDAVEERGWTPNDSLLQPTALLENMPAFQRGQHVILSAYATAMATASGGANTDLTAAADSLATDPARSLFHGEFPFVGGAAGGRYLDAADALKAYNRALAAGGDAPGDAAALGGLVGAISRALSAEGLAIHRLVRGEEADEDSLDAEYFEARGAAFAAVMLLRGLREDFGDVLTARGLAPTWAEALEALDKMAVADPLFIGREDLVEQGYLLRGAEQALGAVAAGLAS